MSPRWAWECRAGPTKKKRHWREKLPEFKPQSARKPMGERKEQCKRSKSKDAVRKTRERREANPAFCTVKSQLIVARARAKKGVTNPAKDAILAKFPERNPNIRVGGRVTFVRPGPKRCSCVGRGVVLCFPDKQKRFVAIDRSEAMKTARRLLNIDVVEVADAWVAAP